MQWNLNVHYHRVPLAAVPGGARTALDIGCGDGLLSFDLAARGLDVVGIDLDEPSIERACGDLRASERTSFVLGDVLTHDFDQPTFDLVASVAALHHMDASSGLQRIKALVSPGGVAAIVGFARSDRVRHHALAFAGRSRKGLHRLRGQYWEHNAPTCWPPPLTMGEMQALVQRELPGARFRPLMSERYSIVWSALD